MPLFITVARYKNVNFRNGQKFDQFELFGPPCGNPLAIVDGSMPECAQVSVLHTRPHLATLRKTETADG